MSVVKGILDSERSSGYFYSVNDIERVMHLPRREKLQLMESLWVDLNDTGEEVESPTWHEGVLHETETRLAAGHEEVLGWEEAKRRLRGK